MYFYYQDPGEIVTMSTAAVNSTAIEASWIPAAESACDVNYQVCICRQSDGCTNTLLDLNNSAALLCKVYISGSHN